jgi:2-polyprenyl-6-methoxyphenol hydroxylase-like FAD-dependent oxidoreductase
MDSWPRYAGFLHLRPGIAVMEGVIFWPPERNNFSAWPDYAVFGGQVIPRVTDIPLISEMIRATESTIIGYPFYDIPTQPLWHKEQVVLVGDAIHAVSPSSGQGASLAVEDAMVLARCLRDIPDHALAFATYERLRRGRVERMVRHGRRAGLGKVVTNPIGVWLRDLSMPFFLKLAANPAVGDWIYSYKVDWDEPVGDTTKAVEQGSRLAR